MKSACDYRKVTCPLGCKAAVLHKDLQSHQSSECPNRLVRCPLCDAEYKQKAAAVCINDVHLPIYYHENNVLFYICTSKYLTTTKTRFCFYRFYLTCFLLKL